MCSNVKPGDLTHGWIQNPRPPFFKRRPRIPNWVAAKSQYRAIVVNSMVALGLQFNSNFFNQQGSNV